MSNAFVVSRNHLVFGLCLPIAVLLGYLLAEPLESVSLAVVVMLMSVLFVPLAMKWHHLLVVLCWNGAFVMDFLKGSPPLWVVVVLLSLFIALLNRSLSRERRFLQVPAINRAMLLLVIVVVATALTSGAVGFKIFGSSSHGGKRYVLLMAGILGYYALTSQAIPREKAMWYVAAFFLSGVTAGISNLVYLAGPKFYFLYEFFPADLAVAQANAEGALDGGLVRFSGMLSVSQACTWFLLSRYGVRGVLDFSRPWRLLLLVLGAGASMFAGFRSSLILFSLVFGMLFLVEGLWRTRFLFHLIAALILAGLPAAIWVDRMPFSVQRALSFLPLDVDPQVQEAARSSTEWRLDMWRRVVPEVPRHLFHGKGYAMDPQEMMLIEDAVRWGFSHSMAEGAALAGDYHNGPLSVIIPFGVYGVVAVILFWGVGLRVLYRNYRYGDESLRRVNAFLFAAFLGRIIFFLFIYGALHAEFFYFSGLLGLGVALNRGEARPPPPASEPAWD